MGIDIDPDSTPSFDLPAPTESHASRAMRSRIAERLFDEASPAQSIAHYQVLRRVGSGGMGVVYAARDSKLDRVVAIKLVKRSSMAGGGHERLISVARALAKLSHPNIVQVHEVGAHEGDVYIAMEFVEGQTLSHWRRQTRPSLNKLLQVFVAAGHGLVAAHEAGIIHRDFKPSNVLVGSNGRVRVVDFGLACTAIEGAPTTTDHATTSGSPTSSTRVVGTPGYIAPELFAERPADERSDQFAFCVALCEALSGQQPTTGELLRVRPLWLRRALERGLAEDPAQRWPSMAGLIATLDRTRRIRRRAGVVLLAAGLLGGFGLAQAMSPSRADCSEIGREFDAVWNDERRDLVNAHLDAGGPAWTKAVSNQLELAFAEQREAWLDVRERVCKGSLVNDESGDLQLAHACLDRHLQRIDSLVQFVLSADPRTLVNIDDQIAELGDPRACGDGSRLLAAPPPGEHVDEIRQLELELDKLGLRVAGGDFTTAVSQSSRLLERAQAVNYPRILAEVLELQSVIASERGDAHSAVAASIETALAAESAGDDLQVFLARRRLVDLYAEELDNLDAAKLWYAQAQASFARLGSPAVLEVALLDASSELAVAAGELERAQIELERALERARLLDPAHRRVEQLELSLANLLADRGDHPGALARYRSLAERQAARLGADHPSVAKIEHNLGLLHFELDDLDQAQVHLDRALDIQTRAFGDDAPQLLPTLALLAQVALGRDDPEQSLTIATRMIPLEHAGFPIEDDRHFNGSRLLARAYMVKHDYAAALAVDEALLTDPPSQMPAEIRADLELERGWLLCRLERCMEARAAFEFAGASADPATQQCVALGLAEVDLARGDADAAWARLEALDELLPEDAFDPGFQAELHAIRALTLAQRSPASEALDAALALAAKHIDSLPPDLSKHVEALLDSQDQQ
ncbi:serine/threonine-protein kinase [Enhygromyxa salina]|uniref:Serine/threonine-protein kinase PK-1 n=1 Tax=Enhygromyxa salina TaxID=215803 RepID=A0A2S9XN91_9BACT|nr:serine/threonine-protein kinase [Enhygromyxa salina]PRP94322.1 Serine/threonine-protein kinase PK-1 [Enhygromyxa salina]